MPDDLTSDIFHLARPSAARDVLARHGLRLGRAFGQHLLVDPRVLARIIEAARLGPDDVVLEVGPGIGTLTRALAFQAGFLIAVEADRRLEPVLSETLADVDNVRIVWADALSLPAAGFGSPPPSKLVSNLPYNVAATLVLRLLDELGSIDDATVMVQREVGERMAAVPSTKAYGGYTVKLALRARARVAFRVPPGAFFPPPKVESVVVRLTRVAPPAGVASFAVIDAVIDAAFGQRRKMLRSALASGLGASREAVEAALETARIEPTVRAETLTSAEFVRLARACDRSGLVNLRSYPDQHRI